MATVFENFINRRQYDDLMKEMKQASKARDRTIRQQKLRERQSIFHLLHSKGVSYKKIGEEFGITRQRVEQIIHKEYK